MAKIKSYCLITLWCLQVIVIVTPQEDNNNNNNNDSSQVIETHYSGRYIFIMTITRMTTSISSKAFSSITDRQTDKIFTE